MLFLEGVWWPLAVMSLKRLESSQVLESFFLGVLESFFFLGGVTERTLGKDLSSANPIVDLPETTCDILAFLLGEI